MLKKSVKIASLVIILVFVVGLNTAMPCFLMDCFFGKSEASEKKEAGKEIAFYIEGMTCASCNLAVKTALKKLDGVIDAKADYKGKSAWARYDDKKVKPEDMLKAIRGLGFKPSLPVNSE